MFLIDIPFKGCQGHSNHCSCSDTSTFEYPIQVGSDTITACLLNIYFLKYLAVTSPIILLSHSTKISVIPSQHKINKITESLIDHPKGPLHSPPSGDCKSLTKSH
jgi:hypothetical protein